MTKEEIRIECLEQAYLLERARQDGKITDVAAGLEEYVAGGDDHELRLRCVKLTIKLRRVLSTAASITAAAERYHAWVVRVPEPPKREVKPEASRTERPVTRRAGAGRRARS